MRNLLGMTLPWVVIFVGACAVEPSGGPLPSSQNGFDRHDLQIDDGAGGGWAGGDHSVSGYRPVEDGDGGARDDQLPSCAAVAHIGDSLSAQTIDGLIAAYADQGMVAEIDAYGGRAIIQKLPRDPRTGLDAAAAIRAAGFDGCWVVALGTNDTANVAAGAWYTRAQAIDRMMTAIDDTGRARVIWVNTFSLLDTGPWASSNMRRWNTALEEARLRWPNMAVFDWAKVAATGAATIADGVHHGPNGYAVRNQAIAAAVRELGEAER